MKILVVGSNGQVGSELKLVLPTLVRAKKIDHIEIVHATRDCLDLSEPVGIPAFLEQVSPDYIVNASAFTAVDDAEVKRELAFLVNDRAVREMALYCKQNKKCLIHISTDYVFDGNSDIPYVETDSVGPSGVYGQSKLAGENAILELLAEHIIIRTSWIFGVSGNNFVKTMLRLAETKDEVAVIADQCGSPTSARAIAETISDIILQLCSAVQPNVYWGTYHFSGTPFVTWADFAEEIFEQATQRGLIPVAPRVTRIKSSEYPTLATRPANSKLDCNKLKNTFDIEPNDWRNSLAYVLNELDGG